MPSLHGTQAYNRDDIWSSEVRLVATVMARLFKLGIGMISWVEIQAHGIDAFVSILPYSNLVISVIIHNKPYVICLYGIWGGEVM